MTITEFLLARIAEDEAESEVVLRVFSNRLDDMNIYAKRMLAECAAKRAIIEQHKDWPVLVERGPTQIERNDDLEGAVFRVSQEMAWLTEREYVKRFGVEAPTTNMVLALAAVYKDHPDYDETWKP